MTSLAGALFAALLFLQPQPAALRIVVIEGEGAVNIIQQKTAVRPLVEVRDRNNVPVAGATVTFTIGGQPAAFAGGLQTLTVTTNAAGQAAASGLNAISSGAFQIQVQAAYQGQIATAAISQTNFATAAAAAQASSGGATGAGGGAAGGGGGISGTTLGIAGAAVAGGALAATQLGGGDDDSGVVIDPPGLTTWTAPVSGQIVVTTVTGQLTCVSTRSLTGTLRIGLEPPGHFAGRATVEGTEAEVSASPTCGNFGQVPFNYTFTLFGGPANLNGELSTTNTGGTPTGGSVTVTNTIKFTGSLAGNATAITGTLSYTTAARGNNPTNTIVGNGSATIQLTLTR